MKTFKEAKGRTTMAKDAKLSLTDSLILSLVGGLIESGFSATRIIDIAGINGNTPNDKRKNKRRIRELIEYATNQDKLAENEIKQRAVNEVLQFMGIYKE